MLIKVNLVEAHELKISLTFRHILSVCAFFGHDLSTIIAIACTTNSKLVFIFSPIFRLSFYETFLALDVGIYSSRAEVIILSLITVSSGSSQQVQLSRTIYRLQTRKYTALKCSSCAKRRDNLYRSMWAARHPKHVECPVFTQSVFHLFSKLQFRPYNCLLKR